MLGQRLQQKLLQKLTPQQILLMKLLQVPTVTLDQRIKQELEENPALEELSDGEDIKSEDEFDDTYSESTADNSRDTDDYDFNDYLDEDDVNSYKLQTNNYSEDDEKKDVPLSIETTFQDNLIEQFQMLGLEDKLFQIGLTLIGNLDDSGYLMRDIDAMVDDFAFSLNIETTKEEITSVLCMIQELDPPGIGAHTLQECLLLQLKRKTEKTTAIKLAIEILENHFDRFSKRHYDKIIEKLDITEEDLKDAINEVLRLNPKPGNSMDTSGKSSQYIMPDFFINNNNGVLELTLNNRNVPDLRVSQTYADMLHTYSETKNKSSQQKDAVMFIKQKIDSARWFIDAIKQRNNTLYVTMEAIMNYQKEYFLEGDISKLKPMILKDIADVVGLDLSTISRVSNSKYAQTHFGTFLLKDFFAKTMSTDSGEDVTNNELKNILTECIENEDKTSPLNDDELQKILTEKGYIIARRTVAKYRELLGIPRAQFRKEI
ncbi:MAG: RNA polymerase factor sigma-54 [Bacteroidota bacterium]